MGGDLAIEDEEVLEERVESVTCRWCGASGDDIVTVAVDEGSEAICMAGDGEPAAAVSDQLLVPPLLEHAAADVLRAPRAGDVPAALRSPGRIRPAWADKPRPAASCAAPSTSTTDSAPA